MIARYRSRRLPLWFRGDAAFAKPELYELLEAAGIGYVIRLPANRVLQERIGHPLTRPVGRPPNKPQVFFASFSYQAQSWSKPRRVVAKVEWHQGELYPRVGFILSAELWNAPPGEVVSDCAAFAWSQVLDGQAVMIWEITGLSITQLAARSQRSARRRD